jgi:hypothetical protein
MRRQRAIFLIIYFHAPRLNHSGKGWTFRLAKYHCPLVLQWSWERCTSRSHSLFALNLLETIAIARGMCATWTFFEKHLAAVPLVMFISKVLFRRPTASSLKKSIEDRHTSCQVVLISRDLLSLTTEAG